MWLLILSSSTSAECAGSVFDDFAKDKVPDLPEELPEIPRDFQFNDDLQDIYETGAVVEISCKRGDRMSYPAEPNQYTLKCNNEGGVGLPDGMKYLHCMKNSYCSAAYFDADWIIEGGYKLHKDIRKWRSGASRGPLIAKAVTSMTEEEMKQLLLVSFPKDPGSIQKEAVGLPSGTTYIPAIRLECGGLSTKQPPAGKLVVTSYPPYAFCYQKPGSRVARWSTGPKVGGKDIWMSLQSQCVAKTIRSKKDPPPDGCSVMARSKTDCLKYNRYCAWTAIETTSYPIDPKKIGDPRVCRYDCVPWSCYAALLEPIGLEMS